MRGPLSRAAKTRTGVSARPTAKANAAGREAEIFPVILAIEHLLLAVANRCNARGRRNQNACLTSPSGNR